MAFTHIKIVGIDQKSSTRESGDLFNVALNLSTAPPPEWNQLFNANWGGVLYSMKRKAYASRGLIIITCVPAELETDHISYLNAAVAETNATYVKYLAERQVMKDKVAKKDTEDKALLSGIEAKLFQ